MLATALLECFFQAGNQTVQVPLESRAEAGEKSAALTASLLEALLDTLGRPGRDLMGEEFAPVPGRQVVVEEFIHNPTLGTRLLLTGNFRKRAFLNEALAVE